TTTTRKHHAAGSGSVWKSGTGVPPVESRARCACHLKLTQHHAASQFGLIPADALLLSVMPFVLKSDYQPCGDQPQAIDALVRGLNDGSRDQVLLGITGSGKTFTVASVIERTERPTLVIAHNKTLRAQLYQDYKSLFPAHA